MEILPSLTSAAKLWHKNPCKVPPRPVSGRARLAARATHTHTPSGENSWNPLAAPFEFLKQSMAVPRMLKITNSSLRSMLAHLLADCGVSDIMRGLVVGHLAAFKQADDIDKNNANYTQKLLQTLEEQGKMSFIIASNGKLHWSDECPAWLLTALRGY